MSCIVCGSKGGLYCKIRDMTVRLCADHLDGVYDAILSDEDSCSFSSLKARAHPPF